MPLGVLTDEEFELELEKLSNVKHEVIIKSSKGPGRPEDKKNTPESARKVIAECMLEGADRAEVAKAFNVGEQVPSVYKSGATSQNGYQNKDKSLVEFLSKARGRVVEKATGKLVGALDTITDEKMAKLKVKDASGVARDMSAIIKNLTPQESNQGAQTNVQVVVYAPPIKSEDSYEVIDLGSQ